MRHPRHRSPSPAMVVALLALFIALGGTSYAAATLARNSVGPAQLRSNSVGASEIRRNAVASTEIRDRSINLRDISTSTRTALRGAPGATGPAGATGPTGPAGTAFSAAINSGARPSLATPGAAVIALARTSTRLSSRAT